LILSHDIPGFFTSTGFAHSATCAMECLLYRGTNIREFWVS